MSRKQITMTLTGLAVIGLIAGCGLGWCLDICKEKCALPSNFCVKTAEISRRSVYTAPYFTYTGKYIAYIQQLN